MILGLLGLYFFLVFFNIAGAFLVNFAGFLLPGYYSLDALFSSSKVDDTQVRSHFQSCVPALVKLAETYANGNIVVDSEST